MRKKMRESRKAANRRCRMCIEIKGALSPPIGQYGKNDDALECFALLSLVGVWGFYNWVGGMGVIQSRVYPDFLW
jgi:hypothetical protein